jgi:hypothetical protein
MGGKNTKIVREKRSTEEEDAGQCLKHWWRLKNRPYDPVGFQKNWLNSVKSGQNLFESKCE